MNPHAVTLGYTGDRIMHLNLIVLTSSPHLSMYKLEKSQVLNFISPLVFYHILLDKPFVTYRFYPQVMVVT